MASNLTAGVNGKDLFLRASHATGKRGNDPFPVFTGVDNLFIARPYIPVDGYSDKFYASSNLNVIANIITWSTSTHTERSQVRILGKKNSIGMTTGGNTIAGSIICHYTVLPGLAEIHPMFSEKFKNYTDSDGAITDNFYDTFRCVLENGGNFIMNNTAPFDMIIKSNNESGYDSSSIIYGITIQDSSEVRNINDMTIEITYQYIANGAIMSLPGKIVDKFMTAPGRQWSRYLQKMEMAQNSYGLISIGKRKI